MPDAAELEPTEEPERGPAEDEDDRCSPWPAQDRPQPERRDEEPSDEEEDAVVSDEKPLMAIYSADRIPAADRRRVDEDEPWPDLDPWKEGTDSEEQPADDGEDAAQRAPSRSHPRVRHRRDSLAYKPAMPSLVVSDEGLAASASVRWRPA